MLNRGNKKHLTFSQRPEMLCLICTLWLNPYVWLKAISSTVTYSLKVKMLIFMFREERAVPLHKYRNYDYIAESFVQILCILYNYIKRAWQSELEELSQTYSVRCFVLFCLIFVLLYMDRSKRLSFTLGNKSKIYSGRELLV